jgi:hypothetical protein
MKTHLRIHARAGNFSHQPQAGRPMQNCVARATDLGPVGENFGAASRAHPAGNRREAEGLYPARPDRRLDVPGFTRKE